MAHLTREEVLASGEVDPEYRKAFEARPVDLTGNDIVEIRAKRAAQLQKLRHLYPIPGPIPDQVNEYVDTFTARDGAPIRVKVYQPVQGAPEGGSPLVLMYHEGGFAAGDLTDEDLNCRIFARDLGCVCVNVEYRLAPEHPFPTGVNDSWDAIEWALCHASAIKATPTAGLIVGGSSSGGNFSAVLALLARDRKLDPPITGQFLSVPAVLPDTNVPACLAHLYQSRSTSRSDPVLKSLAPGQLEALYAPERTSPLWDPFNHPAGHAGVAKAFFQVAGLDPLRDEAVLYDGVLRKCGVLTRFALYSGYGHMFWTYYPEVPMSSKFVEDTVRGMKWLLEKQGV